MGVFCGCIRARIGCECPLLIEAAAAQVVGDNDVSDGVEHELDVVGIGGAGHVAVDLLGGGFVLRLELGLDVRGRFAVFLCACGTTKTMRSRDEIKLISVNVNDVLRHKQLG